MPVNLLDIQRKLRDFSAQSKARHEKLAGRQSEAADLLSGYANRLEELRNRVSRAADLNLQLRCAIPTDEALDSAIPAPALPETFTLLAADGSQINPSRHARVAFGVINIGLVRMVRGSGEAPQVLTRSQLLDLDSLYTPGGRLVSEGAVALKRDLLERQALAAFADDLVQPAVSMTDGPLELYREPSESEGYAKSLDQYIEVLGQLQDQNLMTLGYVDKPGSDLVGRLLELVQLEDAELADKTQQRRLAGLSDSQLLTPYLPNPGDRSAVFGIISQIGLRFRGDLALHFFYLNVGQPGKPHLVRVEVPQWVAKDKAKLGFLQAALLEQSRIMGTRPYPYILHRAHEIAIVSLAEHEHVEEMIIAEFTRRGIPVDEKSNKQYHKDLSTGKTRYEG